MTFSLRLHLRYRASKRQIVYVCVSTPSLSVVLFLLQLHLGDLTEIRPYSSRHSTNTIKTSNVAEERLIYAVKGEKGERRAQKDNVKLSVHTSGEQRSWKQDAGCPSPRPAPYSRGRSRSGPGRFVVAALTSSIFPRRVFDMLKSLLPISLFTRPGHFRSLQPEAPVRLFFAFQLTFLKETLFCEMNVRVEPERLTIGIGQSITFVRPCIKQLSVRKLNCIMCCL